MSLYGHKMPVLCLDYSSDDALIVSGSADKYVRVWGSDFGDCHFALLAHGGPVTQVAFVKDTHYFLSCGRDGAVKYWDADRRLLVKEIAATGHDLWSLAASSLGDLVVVAGKERLLRCFKQSKDQIFAHLEDEGRKEKVSASHQTIVDSFLKDANENQDDAQIGKRDLASLKHGEDIIEAIVEAEKMREEYQEYESDLSAWTNSGKVGQKPQKPDMLRLGNSQSIPE